jgi:multisubunit Na+/H+ antiporter MnhC subunit
MSLTAGIVSALCGVRLEKSVASPKVEEDVRGQEDQNKDVAAEDNASTFSAQVNPVPIAFLIIAIVVGSLIGIQARTRECLQNHPNIL